MAELKKIGVVLKRARYFIKTADYPAGFQLDKESVLRALIDPGVYAFGREQLSLFRTPQLDMTAYARLSPGEGSKENDTVYPSVEADGILDAFPIKQGTVQEEFRPYQAQLPDREDVPSVEEGVEEAIRSMVKAL